MKWNILFLKTTFVSLKNPQQELFPYQTFQPSLSGTDYYKQYTGSGNYDYNRFVNTEEYTNLTGLLQPPELRNWTVGYSNVQQDLFLTGENLTFSANNIHINCNRLFINGKEYDPNNIFNNSNKKT